MMIWIAYIAGGLVGLVVLMALVGLALPRDHVAARSAMLPAPPEAVWRALTDLAAHPTWRRGLAKIDIASPTRFTEHGANGKIAFEIVEDRPRERRVTRIADDKLPFGGRWTFELAADGTGTKLTITEDGFVKNPVFRFLSKTVFSPTATLERYLADLDRHLAVQRSAGSSV